MNNYYEDIIINEDKERVETLGMDYDKVEKDIEDTIAKLYSQNNRKPTRGEILATLISDFGYNVSDIGTTVNNHTRGML